MITPPGYDDPLDVHHWFVVFMAGPNDSIWDYLTHPDYRHVCAYGYSVPRQAWVMIDPTLGGTRVTVTDEDGFDQWLDNRAGRMTMILKVESARTDSVRMRLGYWCVTAVKHLLGFSSGALRPQALCRDLIRSGALKAFESDHGCKSQPPKRRRGD